MLECLFWVFALLAGYSYFGYPLLLALVLRIRPHTRVRGNSTAPVTLVVTAFNEEKRIREKLDNCLEIDYEGLEILVASDASTDGTDSIVQEYQGRGVKLVRAAQRLGKENAQLCALRAARGEIIVFSDVATYIPPNAVRNLVAYFSDPDTGAVSSEDRFLAQDGKVAGEGAYVRYEMWLRRMESAAAGLVGLSGSFFAARASICMDWDIQSPSDFNTALNCIRHGMRSVTAPDVLGFYKDLKDPKKEYERKVRTVVRGLTAVLRHPAVLNPLKYGLFSWQVLSHKVMRWMVPVFLLPLFVLNVALLGSGHLYLFTLVAQLAFYGIALAAYLSGSIRRIGPARLIYFFVQVNIAICQALWRVASGRRMTTWTPSSR